MTLVNAGGSRTVRAPVNESVSCSCGTGTVKKLTRYCTRIRTIPTEGPRITSRRPTASIPLREEGKSAFRLSSCMDEFCECLRRQYTVDELVLRCILWTSEAYFKFEGKSRVHKSSLGTG